MADATGTDDIVVEFLIESMESVDQVDRDLVALEADSSDTALLARIFRCVHTIKGTCGFLGFAKLESVAHVGENLLAKMRDGKVAVTPDVTTVLLQLVDAIRVMLGIIEQQGNDGDPDYTELMATLTALTEPAVVNELPEGLVPAAIILADVNAAKAPAKRAPAKRAATKRATKRALVEAALEEPHTTADDYPLLGEILVDQGSVNAADIASAMQEQHADGEQRLGEILVARGMATQEVVVEALEAQCDAAGEARAKSVADSSIRVDVALLDKLMNLVGELVLARNQLVQGANSKSEANTATTTQRLNIITSELQEGVMKTRMQPIGNIWSKMPRIVRDLSLSCHKQVTVEIEGAETELDRTIIEAIKDPLTHIVRNSVDHGIETPEERIARGKPPTGLLHMRAFHEGGKVNIEVRDDGAGIDPIALKAKAVQKGLITAEVAQKMTDREALNLIFAAGLSTAAAVTNVSGRGVGMDVVKTNIEKIGGTVDVTSVRHQGTSLRMKIPLTLAIIPGLVVTTSGHRYAIPQVSLLELVRLEGDEAKQRIERIYGAPVYRLRGKLLPLISLNAALDFTTEPWACTDDSIVNIVVLQADGTSFGLIVDSISDTEEIVVKPLGKQLKGIAAFAGATIMGDGEVALILDVLGLAQEQGIIATAHERAAAERADAPASHANLQQLLLFALGTSHRVAFPLSVISRLEEFSAEAVEHTGRSTVVQYRNRILPLLRLDRVLDGVEPRPSVDDTLRVIVYEHNGRSIGFVIDEVLDVVEADVSIDDNGVVGAVAGSAIVQGKVTDVLDVEALLALINEPTASAFQNTRSNSATRELANV